LKVTFINLRGGGEPTTHPEYDTFALMYAQEGFELSLLTNATSLDSTKARFPVEAFSFLIVNLDANDDEVYNQIHPPPDLQEFQKVLANIEKVVSERERRESKLMVGAQIRLCQANVNFMEQITCLARDLGIDYVQFLTNPKISDCLLPDQEDQVNSLLTELRHARIVPFPFTQRLRAESPAERVRLLYQN
jgi:wyosine [tRNA(Phe)-imidazoG37] synthetase (radical SAM superfamily)